MSIIVFCCALCKRAKVPQSLVSMYFCMRFLSPYPGFPLMARDIKFKAERLEWLNICMVVFLFFSVGA